MWETCYFAKPNIISVKPSLMATTHSFFRAHPPTQWVKKCHSLTLSTKLQLQLTIWRALVQNICLTTEKYVCLVKDFKTTLKINKSN